MEKDDLLIREYSEHDYNDIINSGYPFDQYLKVDLYHRIKMFLSRKGIKKYFLKKFFLNQEQIELVAYSLKGKKTIGIVTLRKINNNLWEIGPIFVSPSYRRKGIATLLRNESFKFLRKRNVKKVVASVSSNNVASVKGIEKNYQGFFSKKLYECAGRPLNLHVKLNKIAVRKFHRGDEKDLFEIFKRCVDEQWYRFLGITEDNFLDRIAGSAYCEPFGEGLLPRLFIRKDILIAEYEGRTQGYIVSLMVRFPFSYAGKLHIFVPVSENFNEIIKSLVLRAVYKRKKEINFVFIGNEEIEDNIQKLGLKVVNKILVSYKNLL